MNKDIIINYIMWCKETHCDLCISDKPILDSCRCVNCFYNEQEKVEGMTTELEEITNGIIKYEYEIKENYILITLKIGKWNTIVEKLFRNPLKPRWIEGGGIDAEMRDYCDSLNESLYDYVKHGNSVRKLFGFEEVE